MFALMNDFDDQTRGGARCNACGSIKQDGDPGVFRGEMIDMEGFYDVCCNCVRQAGSEIGMVAEDRYQLTRSRYEKQIQNLQVVADRVHELEERCRMLSEMNAELVVAQAITS